MTEPPSLHDAVAQVIRAVDEAPTVWQAELEVSQLLGQDWLSLPLDRATLVDLHLRMVSKEAAQFKGHARTLQAVLAHLTSNEKTLVRVNMSSRALGILQPWVPLLDTVELVQTREAEGQIVLQCGYRLDDGLVDEHYLTVTIEDDLIQHIDVTDHAPDLAPVDPDNLAPRLATIMINTTWRNSELKDPASVNGPWALLNARVRTGLPPVLSMTRMLPDQVNALAGRFVRLKAAKRIADEQGLRPDYLRYLAAQIIDFENTACPGGWTQESIQRFYAERAPRIDCAGDEELLGQVLIAYLVWRMGKLGYKPLVEAASEAHLRYLEAL